MKLRTLLNFDGNCAEAFRFYEKHLGGKITMMMTHGEAPGASAPAEIKDKVLHARLSLGGTELLAADMPPGVQKPMRSAYLSLSTDSSAEAERVFAALAEGGEVLNKMEETFFAHRFGVVRDRFGVLWMVLHERPMQ